MPVKVQADLPVKEILESENIFVMDETRAVHQDIRPLKIMILNLMPLKEDTELQLLRSLSNTSLQVDVTFLMVASHEAKNTSTSHLNTFYVKFEDVRKNYYDGMIITGAPVEQMEFEEVDYWDELTKIMDWTNTHVTSTMFENRVFIPSPRAAFAGVLSQCAYYDWDARSAEQMTECVARLVSDVPLRLVMKYG